MGDAPSVDHEMAFTFSLVDNVSPVCDRMSAANEELAKKAEKAQDKIDSQNISFIAQIVAVTAVHAGMRRVTSSMRELGLVSDEDADKLNKVNAAVGLVVGTFQAMKGSIKIINTLKNAEIALAAVETYRSVLKNPAAMATVTAGLALAGGAGGYLLGQSQKGGGGVKVDQSVSISQGGMTPSQRRSITRDTMDIMGGG